MNVLDSFRCCVTSSRSEYPTATDSHEGFEGFVGIAGHVESPVECKAGNHVKAKSMMVYMEKYDPVYAIRISARNFGMVNGIKSVPLYSVFCIWSNNRMRALRAFYCHESNCRCPIRIDRLCLLALCNWHRREYRYVNYPRPKGHGLVTAQSY